MRRRPMSWEWWGRAGSSLASCLALAALLAGCGEEPAPADALPEPTTQPATRAATEPGPSPVAEAEPEVFDDYLDLVLERRPSFPTTRPLDRPVAFEEAEKLTFSEPVYLDPAGNLWIGHERGQSPHEVTAGGSLLRQKQSFVVHELPLFAWWRSGPGKEPAVELIVRRDDGGHDWVHLTGRAAIPPAETPYDFGNAFMWNDLLVVPTDGGVAVLTPANRPADPGRWLRRYGHLPENQRPDGAGEVEVEQVRLSDLEDAPPTQVRLDGIGLLAWVPWDHGLSEPGGEGVARFIEGKWQKLPENEGWAERPTQLMPMADGSVLQLAVDSSGDHALKVLPLNEFPIDRAIIEQLVADLTAYDRPTRESAFAQLNEAGAAAWPILEELLPTAKPRAQGEIDTILANRDQPTLGGIVLEPGPVEVRERLRDGGVILTFPNGVALPSVAGVTVLERPGHLVVRPGRRIGPLSGMLVSELEADPETRLFVWGDEWVVCRPGLPPRRWGVNHFAPLLGDKQTQWQYFVGIDSMGRWIFRENQAEPVDSTTRPTTRPTTSPTLIVDVRLPDPRPQLPTWVIETGELGEAGWDPEDYPTMKLGGAWRLLENGWEPLPPKTEVHTRETKTGAWELATGADGRSYYGGIDDLRISVPGEGQFTWKLPPEAVGVGNAASVKLAVDDKGRLFLFNRPGRVVRIEPTEPGSEQQYEVIGVFDEEIPGAVPRRVWVDPVGRICAAYFGDTVVVMWPDGQVPPAIRQLMPAKRRENVSPFEGA